MLTDPDMNMHQLEKQKKNKGVASKLLIIRIK